MWMVVVLNMCLAPKVPWMTLLKLAYPLLIASATLCAAAPAPEAAPHFESTIKPFLKEYCVKCHNPKKFAGDVDLEAFLARPAEQALAERKTWSVVSKKLKEGEMPPAEEDQPGDAEIAGVVHWLEGQFAIQDRTAKPNAGSVAVRRLNRQEYNNTIRDLLGVNFRFSEDFPTD